VRRFRDARNHELLQLALQGGGFKGGQSWNPVGMLRSPKFGQGDFAQAQFHQPASPLGPAEKANSASAKAFLASLICPSRKLGHAPKRDGPGPCEWRANRLCVFERDDGFSVPALPILNHPAKELHPGASLGVRTLAGLACEGEAACFEVRRKMSHAGQAHPGIALDDWSARVAFVRSRSIRHSSKWRASLPASNAATGSHSAGASCFSSRDPRQSLIDEAPA